MKKKILTLFSALLLIVMLFTLTGCGENKENINQEEQGENVVQEVADTVKLNDELNEVCGFAQEIQGNQYKIVGLKILQVLAMLNQYQIVIMLET